MNYPKIDFSKFEPFSELVFDTTLASDPNKTDDLSRFVVTFYHHEFTGDQLLESEANYQNLINVAIQSGNLKGLETLWKGIYYHDRNNPDFESDFYTALECANLETIQHVHNAYKNYATLQPFEPIDSNKAKELAKNNSNTGVFDYISTIF